MYEPEYLRKWTYPKDYSGEEWYEYYGFLGQSRDSGPLERSNFQSGLAELGGESETVFVVREHHWAVGWVEWIAIHESDSAALKKADDMMRRLENYPVLDEDLFSQMEYDEFLALFENEFSSEQLEEALKIYNESDGSTNPDDMDWDLIKEIKEDFEKEAELEEERAAGIVRFEEGDLLEIRKRGTGATPGYAGGIVVASEPGWSGGWEMFEGTRQDTGEKISFYGISIESKVEKLPSRPMPKLTGLKTSGCEKTICGGMEIEPTPLSSYSIRELARIIRNNWDKVYFGAVPYLKAMGELEFIDDRYYMDEGRSIVAYFLANAKTWRGPIAKKVKEELNRRLKE